jgi:hypothetical protein
MASLNLPSSAIGALVEGLAVPSVVPGSSCVVVAPVVVVSHVESIRSSTESTNQSCHPQQVAN